MTRFFENDLRIMDKEKCMERYGFLLARNYDMNDGYGFDCLRECCEICDSYCGVEHDFAECIQCPVYVMYRKLSYFAELEAYS